MADLGHEPAVDPPDPRLSPRESLRVKLAYLQHLRGDHREFGKKLARDVEDALLEARETPGLTMQEAADLLGISRQATYRFLGEARKRAER